MNKNTLSFIIAIVTIFLMTSVTTFAQSISINDLKGTVWESKMTENGETYICRYEFLSDNLLRLNVDMYNGKLYDGNNKDVYKYSVVNSSRIHFSETSYTPSGNRIVFTDDLVLKKESGTYFLVDNKQREYKFLFRVSVRIFPSQLTLAPGKETTLEAHVSPSSASYLPLTWKSENPDVATVHSITGKVTAIRSGEAKITANCCGITSECAVVVHIPVSSVSLNYNSISLYPGESATLNALVTRSNGKTSMEDSVVWTSDNPDVATVSSTGEVNVASNTRANTVTIVATCEDKQAECTINVLSGKREARTADLAIDMGLSVKWASCNLGEEGFVRSPQDAGDYYAWGEIATKSTFKWDTYKWKKGSIYNRQRCRLEEEDDVASRKLGGSWRIPTHDEFEELIDNCKIKIKTIKGVDGYLLTSKINGNSIFLPATKKSIGNYWCSDLCNRHDTGFPWYFYFNYRDNEFKCIEASNGFSIRPVCD